RFETIMFGLNCIIPEAADELLTLTREHDVAFIAMKAMAGGVLDNPAIAFKYLFQFPDILMLAGVQSVEEIDEIMEVFDGPRPLTEADEAEIQRLRQELGTRFCRRCEYCQPCTVEIPISQVIMFRTALKRLPPARLFSGNRADVMARAADCTECGDCEERCPYNLPIREMIKENLALFEEAKRNYQGVGSR
ncbi:4Fe-4S dicluster domain-containing protein, partial [Chloroflexota bacterium]